MNEGYLGTLPPSDPLHEYLKTFLEVEEPVFEAYSMHPEKLMVRYEERGSGARLACKFYARKLPVHCEPTDEYFRERLHEELGQMKQVRSLGFDRPPFWVARPLGVNEDLEFLLVEEFVDGPHLDDFVKAAFEEGKHEPLSERLRDLGHFLGRLHKRSRHGLADPEPALGFLKDMLADLKMDPSVVDAEAWRPLLAEAPAVLQHGDSTPMNFVFPAPGEVVALDLERSRRGDGMADVGSLQAELFTAGLERARPHLETLRAAYHEEEPEENPDRRRFWTGAFLLRIARNDWLKPEKRPLILKEAMECLKL